MRASLVSNGELVFGIKKLKKLVPSLQAFGLSNMPSWDYEQLKSTLDDWDIFDDVLISANLRQRKPDHAAYKAFLNTCGIDAGSCIFVDDRLENVVAAHSLGFEGILFERTESTLGQLYQHLLDPANRGRLYLRANAKNLSCELSTGGLQPDNYSQLLILEHSGER
jgi:FMN phosphatase YigB (HAD superfamily)